MEVSDSGAMKSAAVSLLCPVTVQLLKNPSVQAARALTKALAQVKTSLIQELQSYIIYPVEAGLRSKNVSESLITSLCEVLHTLLNKSRITTVKIFYQLHTTLLSLLSDSRYQVPAKLSEETETAIIKIIILMLKVSDKNVLSEFYSINCIHILAQQITVLINIAKLDKSRDLQKLALECMLQFMQTETDFGKENALKLGDLFAHCLPGIVTGMVFVVTGSTNQGQAVFVKATSVCCRLLTLTMSDELLQECQKQIESNKLNGIDPREAIDAPLRSLYIERNEAWLKSTSTHLSPVINAFCTLVSNSHWRVRQALVEFAEQLLMTCSRSLSQYIHKLLESLVGLIHDPYKSVSTKAVQVLETFEYSHSGSVEEKTLTEILEENIFNLAASLPRLIKFSDEENKPHLINLLRGYITLLGNNLSSFISSSPHIKRVCLVLVQILEMEITDVRIVEERGSLLHTVSEVFTDINSVQIWRPTKYFKHFRDSSIYDGLMDVCRLLGQYGNIYILVDHMLELYQESVVYKLAAVLVINEMIVGASHSVKNGTSQVTETQLLKDVIKMLIDEYLSPSNLKLIKDITSSQQQSAKNSTSTSLVIIKQDHTLSQQDNSLANKNRTILLTCLFMEGLGKFATAIGKDFQVHLIKTLYPLVENLGHENLYLSSTAYSSLVEVAFACGYSSLDQLIRNNADYLVACVSQRLRHFDEHYRAPRTICVILRYCSKDLLYLISHSITQLFESLDDNYSQHLILFMPVLLELVSAMGRWFPSQTPPAEQEELKQEKCTLDSEELISCITEYMKNKTILHEYLSDGSLPDVIKQERTLNDIEADMKEVISEQSELKGEQEDEKMAEEEEAANKELPKHVQIVQEVFKRIRNLMLCNEPNLRVMALDIICQGCQDLGDYERELLPQLHQLWPSLVTLFRHSDKCIVIKAIKTLLMLSKLSGDFMRSRIMKEVIPGISSYMKQQALISCESRSAYLYTNNHKLQLCVLTSLGPLAENLKLDSNDLAAVVDICLPYLSELQPVALQQAAVDSCSSFYTLEPDALWFTLNMIYSPLLLTPPGPEYFPMKFPVNNENNKNFVKNISCLLEKYYSL